MGVASPLEGVRARNSFNLGTSLASTLGLGSEHRSDRGTNPKTMIENPKRQFQRAERSVSSLVQ